MKDRTGSTGSFPALFPLSRLLFSPSLHCTPLPFPLYSFSLCSRLLSKKNFSLSVFFISFFFPALAFFPLLVPPSQMIFLISGWFGHEGVTEELGLTRSLAFWGFQLHLAGADLGLVQSEGVWGGVVPFPLAQGFRSSQARGGACCTPHLLPVVGNNAPLHLGLWLFCPLPLWLAPSQVNPFHQSFGASRSSLGRKVLALG